jgi:hypothetical protein
MRTLQEYTRLKARPGAPADMSWQLVLDNMIFRAEAEVRWLDHCESSLAKHKPPPLKSLTAPDEETRSRCRG